MVVKLEPTLLLSNVGEVKEVLRARLAAVIRWRSTSARR